MILPDANLLVAFTWENHQHKTAAENFFQQYPKVATPPVHAIRMARTKANTPCTKALRKPNVNASIVAPAHQQFQFDRLFPRVLRLIACRSPSVNSA